MSRPMIHVRVKPPGVDEGLHAVDQETVEKYLSREWSPFIEWYDTIQGPTHTIEVLDLAIPGFLAAPPDFKRMLDPKAWSEPMPEALRHASQALGRLPVDVDLWDWVPAADEPARDERRRFLVKLFQATTGGDNHAIPPYGAAACTKLLHRKRPRLVPIIDSGIYRAWAGKDSVNWRTEEMANIALLMADELREPERQTELDAVETLARGLWPGVLLSKLRLYDIISYHVFEDLKKR
ncbi:MAG: DUF6308 family protein [Actinomycetota bacterium]